MNEKDGEHTISEGRGLSKDSTGEIAEDRGG
jgi:hypothetical protein